MAIDRGRDRLGADSLVGVVEHRADLLDHATRVVVRIRELALTVTPFVVVRLRRVEVVAVGLGGNAGQQFGGRQPSVADHGMLDRGAPSDVAGPMIDLDHPLAARVPVGVREVRAEHQQQVARFERVLRRWVTDQPALSDLEPVVALEPFLRLEREHHRCPEMVGERQHLLARAASTAADEERDLGRLVDRRCSARQLGLVGNDRHLGPGEARRVRGGLEPGDVARNGQHRDARPIERPLNRLLKHSRQAARDWSPSGSTRRHR